MAIHWLPCVEERNRNSDILRPYCIFIVKAIVSIAVSVRDTDCVRDERVHFRFRLCDLLGNNQSRPANLENVFRGTFHIKKRDLPTEINCVPKYTVARRFGRGTVLFFREIERNFLNYVQLGAPRQRYKKIRLRTKSGTFP